MILKTAILFVLLAIFAATFAGCGGSAENTETANANTADNPFANITDANQALAEGNRLLDEDRIELAVQAFTQAVNLNPELAEAWFKLGIGYSLLEMAAQQAGDKVIGESDGKTKPDSQKAFGKAVEAYKKWLDANPNDDVGWFNMGRAYVKLLKDEEAEKAFRQAVKLKPDDIEYLTELGFILIRLAKYHEALDPLKKAVEIDPENARAQDLLEDAEAGRQRLDYVAPNNTNTNKAANSNANANANVNANASSNSAPRNTNMAHRPNSNSRPLPPSNRP